MASLTPDELRELRLRFSLEDYKNLLTALESDGVVEVVVDEDPPADES